MRKAFRARLLVIGLIVASGLSCTETLVGIVEVAVVDIEPVSATVFVDDDVALQARLKDERGNTLSGRQLTWTTGDSQVATVSSAGLVHGISAGVVDIVASSEGISSTARVTVVTRPVIHVDPDSALFMLVHGQVPPVATIDITNSGGSTLSGLTVATTYDAGPAGWLQSSLSGADAPATLTLTPATAGLTPGTYHASVRLTAPDASNNPVTVRVRLELLHPVPTQIAIAGGDGQSAMAGTIVSTPVGVLVTDAGDNPVADVAVTFAVTSGGGSLAANDPVLTSADGIAIAPAWTLGTRVGPNTLSAVADGIAGDSVIFTAIATPGTAAQLAITTEPSAAAPTGVVFARQPVVQLKDAGGNTVTESGVAVTAAIASGGGDLDGVVTVTTSSAGEARFTNLAIIGTVGERTLVFTAERLAPATSAVIAITRGAGTHLALATRPSASAQSGVPFAQQPRVRLQDAGGNAIAQAGILVTAAVLTGEGTLGGTTTATTDADGVARFTDLRITGKVGSRTLAFTASGISAATSDPIAITTGPASAAHSTAVVPDGIAGVATPFTITVRDDGDNPVTGAAAQLAVSISGANAAAPPVSDGGSGSYTATYTPTVTGTDLVAITLGGTGISGSPFISAVTPSGVSDANSSVGVSTSSAVANGVDAATVTVVLRDPIGNPVGGLAGSINVSLSGSASADAVVETSTTGTYMFNVTSTLANLVGIAVTIGGTTLTERPTIDFVAGPIAVAVSDVGATTGVAANGMAASVVTVTLADAFNNPILGLTDADFAIAMSGSGTAIASAVTQSGPPGTYTFSVTNVTAETVVVTVTADGVLLTQTPSIQFIAGGVSGSLSTAVPDRLSGVTANGTDASTVTVTLVDANSNPISGLASGAFVIGLTGSGVASPVAETGVGTGIYTFTVRNTIAEAVTVTVTASSVALTAQPTITFVAGAISSSVSTAASNPTTGVQADGVETSTVTVMLKDANGNPISGVAGSSFTIGTGGSTAVPGTVTETGPGSATYTFTVTNMNAELVTLTVTVSGVQLANQPTIAFVAGGVSGTQSTVTPDRTTGVTADDVDASTVTVVLVDQNGNPITGLTATDFTISVSGSATAGTIAQTATAGTYAFTVTNTVAEIVTVTVTATAVQLVSQPTIEFVAGLVSPANSSVNANPTQVVAGT